MYPAATHSLVTPKEGAIHLIAYCHPGEGRDPGFRGTIAAGFAGSEKCDQEQGGAERWIPASAGMTMGGLS
jgi:hypothetical protein